METMSAYTKYQDTLTSCYGIKPMDVLPEKGGWTASVYRVPTSDSTYFLKVYDRTRESILPWIRRMAVYLPIISKLQDSPYLGSHMPRLIKTLDEQYTYQKGDEVLQLFSYVEGAVPGVNGLSRPQLEELATILASLHGYPASEFSHMKGINEDISLQFCQTLMNLVVESDDSTHVLQKILAPYKDVLIRTISLTQELRDTIRKGCKDLSLCHTDVHNWNLLQGAQLYLLDWEGLCLAPPAADLFMFRDHEKDGVFCRAYEAAGGIWPDEYLLLFYSLHRKLMDIWDFLVQLRHDDPDAETSVFAYDNLGQELGSLHALLDEYGGAT